MRDRKDVWEKSQELYEVLYQLMPRAAEESTSDKTLDVWGWESNLIPSEYDR
jgi:hypothetical protein